MRRWNGLPGVKNERVGVVFVSVGMVVVRAVSERRAVPKAAKPYMLLTGIDGV